jgi:DivIVA domain-containing protein
VALDRESISRRDFPTSRRGYEPASVDAHLAAIADEVEELRRRAGPGAVLATQTSDQVRAILEAAEASAASIREGAGEEARAHVARAAEAADGLRARIDALEADIGVMVATLRDGAERLRAGLDEAFAGVAEPGDAGRERGVVPEGVAPGALGATLGSVPAPLDDEEVDEEPPLTAVAEAPQTSGRSEDVDGARLVALERAMSGRPREETERFLAEHYDLPDRPALVDEAYRLATPD